MKIKNKNINTAYNILIDLNLGVKDTRLRSRFCRQLQDYFINTVKFDVDIVRNKFAIKGENGQIEYNDQGGFTIPLDKIDEYSKEMSEIDEEYLEIENNERNKDMLLTVANILLTNEDIEVSGNSALVHDELCEEFESIIEFYESKE